MIFTQQRHVKIVQNLAKEHLQYKFPLLGSSAFKNVITLPDRKEKDCCVCNDHTRKRKELKYDNV